MLRFSRLVWISLIAMVVLAACSPRTPPRLPQPSPSGSHFCACRNFCARSHRCASRNYRARRDCCAIWAPQATAHWLYRIADRRSQVASQKQTEGLQLWLDDVKKACGIKLKTARCTCRR